MTEELIHEYTVKIAESNRTQLLVTIYDLILLSLEEAKEFESQDNIEQFKHSVRRAQGLVRELMDALDFQYDISMELFQLYLFINRKLLQALAVRKVEPLKGLDKVIKNLRESYQTLSKEDHSAPIMKNTQKVYAGLTYGKTSLSETCDSDANRGFQA